MVMMPWICNIAKAVSTIIPTCMGDKIMDILGVNETMDDFKGRNNK